MQESKTREKLKEILQAEIKTNLDLTNSLLSCVLVCLKPRQAPMSLFALGGGWLDFDLSYELKPDIQMTFASDAKM